MDQIPGKIKRVVADGAYDKKQAREEIFKRKAQQLIPPPKNARYSGIDDERDKAILEICGLGDNREGRSLWGKLTGYNKRVLVETTFSRLKRFLERDFIQKDLIDKELKVDLGVFWSIECAKFKTEEIDQKYRRLLPS